MENQEVKILTNREVLENYRNDFTAKLMGNLLDLKRHEEIKASDPGYKKVNQMGQEIPVNDLIVLYKGGVKNAKEYLKIIDKLLKEEEANQLAPYFEDKYLDQKPVDLSVPGHMKNGVVNSASEK